MKWSEVFNKENVQLLTVCVTLVVLMLIMSSCSVQVWD